MIAKTYVYANGQIFAQHLDHAKREVVAARYYNIPANAVEQAARAKPEGDE